MQIDQCREAFEKHVLAPNGFYENGAGWVARNTDGTYRHENIQARWTAWQAARSAPAAPLSDEQVDALPIVIHLRERIKHWKRESAKQYVEGWNDSTKEEGVSNADAT